MDGPKETNTAGLWLAMGLVAFVLVWAVVMTTLFARQPRFFRFPTEVFESDQEWYDNVFESPIPERYMKYGGNLLSYAWNFTGTTPAKIISDYEKMSGTRLYLDEKAGSLTDRKPPGFLDRLKGWWRSHRWSWLP